MNRAHQNAENKEAAAKRRPPFTLLLLLVLLAPFSAYAADCSVSWDLSVGGCKSDCMKSGVYCSLLDSKSWCSNSTNDCVTEAAKPSNPPNGSYSMNCNSNTWSLACNGGYTTCDGSTCQANTTMSHCDTLNQCTLKCSSCSGGYTTCDGGTTCHANITITNCATVNQCTDKCSTCSGGYTTCDGGTTCHANITLPNCTTVDQCTDLCTACNNGYTLSGGACVGATLKLSGSSAGSSSPYYVYQSADPAGLYVTSDFKVGISTGNPSYMLHVATGAGVSGTLLAVSTGATNVFWAAGDGAHATRFFGDGSGLTGVVSGPADNLGNHTATMSLDMNGNSIINAASGTFTQGITASSFTATGTGLNAAQLLLAGNVVISSEAEAAKGAGVTISSNVYIVGFSSAAKYYGDGSALTGVSMQTFTIGDSFGGGKIFWIDPSGKQVLIAATADQGTNVMWGKNTDFTGANADGVYAGKANTVTISTMQGSGSYAAQVCADYTATVNGEYYDDWYLPSRAELQLLYDQKGTVGGFYDANYWSSNEYVSSTGLAWYMWFGNGGVDGNFKTSPSSVRCVRAGPSSGIGNLPNLLIGTQTFTGANTFELGVTASSFTATGASLGVDTAKVRFTDNGIIVSSASPAQYGGVYISTNVYLAPGAKYYGDGSGLLGGDNLGNHEATTTLNMSGFQVVNVATIVFTGSDGGIVLSPNIDASKNYASMQGIAIGSDTYGNYLDGVGVGDVAQNNYYYGVGLGNNARQNYRFGIGIGYYALDNHDYGVGVGYDAADNREHGVGVGGEAKSNYNSGVGVGDGAQQNHDFGVGIGVEAAYNSDYAVGIGAYSQNNQTFGSALGAYSYAASSSTALGSYAAANAKQSIAIGAGTISNSTGTAEFGLYAVNTNSNLFVGGNIGIGTTSPPAALSLGTYGSSPNWPNLYFGNYPASGGAQLVGNWSGANFWGIGPLTGSGDNTVRIGNTTDRTGTWNSTQNLNLVIGGNVGIGITAPVTKLHVAGGILTVDGSGAGITTTGGITASSFTALGASLGVDTAKLRFTNNGVIVSSASPAQYGGVYISTNVYLAAGSKYYGDGSGLTGGDNLGNHIATKTLNMSAFDIANAGNLTANLSITAYSSMTVAGGAFSVGGSTFVVKGGNVGIGTSSPSAALTLGAGETSMSWPNLFFGNCPMAGGAQLVGNWGGTNFWGIGPLTGFSDNTLRIGNTNNNIGAWAPVQNLNLVIGGNVGIGTTSPVAALDVSGASKLSRYLTQANDAGITLTSADFGKTITVNSASPQTITLPSVTAGDLGAQVTIIKFGAGKVTIQAAGGTYIADSGAGGTIYNNSAAETYATITLRLTSSARWSILGGDGSWTTTN